MARRLTAWDAMGVSLGVLALLVAALVGGVLVVKAPAAALAFAAGVAFVAVVPANLALGLAAFTVIQYLAVLAYPHAHGVSLFKLLIALLVLTWLAMLATGRVDRRVAALVSAEPLLTAAILLFLCLGALSLAWSPSRSTVLSSLGQYGLNFALFPIVFTAMLMKGGPRTIAAAIAVGGAVAVLGGLFSGGVSQGRLTGTIGDPNDLAAQIVPAMIIAQALAFTASTPGRRLFFALLALVCDIGIVLTLSRGGIVAAVAGLLAWSLFSGRARARVAAALLILALLGALVYAIASPSAVRDRITGFGGGTGRTDIWRLGFRAFRHQPVLGGGLGNFTQLTPRYVLEPGAIESNPQYLAVPKVAHNSFLQVLVELGVVGGALFLVIVVAPVVAAARAARRFSARGMRNEEVLARAVFAAMVGILTANLFISGQYEKPLWIVLALGPPLAVLALRAPSDREAARWSGHRAAV